MIKIIMHGCNGHMGQVITDIAKEDTEVEIVAGIDLFPDACSNPYPVFASLTDCIVDADVIIDFSNSKAVDALMEYSVAKQLPVVLCSTGLDDRQLQLVEESSKKVAILRSANMSLGINTILKLAAAAAKVLADTGFDIEIVEKHHNQKLDAPSGTALALADAMNEALHQEYHYVYDRTQKREKRQSKEIGIQAVRGGNIVGEHEIFFCGTDEVIEIKHTAYSKAIFAKGSIQAAKFLAGKKPGFYHMNDVIE